MRLSTKQFLTWLVILFIIGGLDTTQPNEPYPEPASCETDEDCLKGKAKCIRRECHCNGKYDFGDGKQECEEWQECLMLSRCSNLFNCLENPNAISRTTCKCKSGYFGRADGPGCKDAAKEDGKYPCLTKKNCPTYSACDDGWCRCLDGLIGDGEKCTPQPLKQCRIGEDCHKNAVCHRRKCHCVGKTLGNGTHCRDALPCPDTYEEKCKEGGNGVIGCVVNHLLPDQPECKCHVGFKTSEAGICVEMTECEENDLLCPTGMVCKTDKDEYWCDCKDGYEEIPVEKGNGACKDIDECSQEACSAIENSVCVNTEGSYACECKEWFRKSPDQSTCEAVANTICQEGVCKCSPGFAKNSDEECEDVDECSQDETPCGRNEECLNEQGTYSCVCQSGYKKENKVCVRKDQCNCKRDEECRKGKCKCKKGYKKIIRGYCVPRRRSSVEDSLGLSLHGNGSVSTFLLGVLWGLAFTE